MGFRHGEEGVLSDRKQLSVSHDTRCRVSGVDACRRITGAAISLLIDKHFIGIQWETTTHMTDGDSNRLGARSYEVCSSIFGHV